MTSMIKSLAAAGLATVGAYAAAKYGWPLASQTVTSLLHTPAAPAAPVLQAGLASMASPRGATPSPSPPPPAVDPEAEPWTGVLLTQSLDLVARIETRVKSISFRVGDEVRAGQPIAELDTVAQEHELAAAEAAARASQAEAWSASVSVSQARDRTARRAKMFKMGASDMPLVSAEELNDSKFDALSAGARAGAASASAEERRARVASLHQVLREATLRAPFDGIVATRYLEVGAHVRPGMPVVRVVGRGALRVRFAVPETEAKAVSIQTRVAIEWDDRALYGTVDRVAPEVESASSSIIMEALVDGALPDGSERSALAGRVVAVHLPRVPGGR